MLHPDLQVRWINDEVGYGLFASKPIKQGTITYIEDKLELKFNKDNPLVDDPIYGPIIKKFSFLVPGNTRVISWDLAKYINHCCHPNTLTTGYGFEIAIKDIEKDEEVKDDYGLFCDSHPMKIVCTEGKSCRNRVDQKDFASLVPSWDEKVKKAMKHLNIDEQPLWNYLENGVKEELTSYLRGESSYKSVSGNI